MKNRINHRGHGEKIKRSISLCALFLCVLCVLCVLCGRSLFAQTQTAHQRNRYDISLSLDFDNRTYKGTERVRWTNRGKHATSTIFFYLYSNLRVPGHVAPPRTADGTQTSDEPRLEILDVKSIKDNAELDYSLGDQETILRVDLNDSVPANGSVEILIDFKGSVPEIDPEETGLVTHVMQQVSAAISSTRELRRPRDINFRCRGVMMMGSAFPMLAARDGDDWLRRIEPNIGDSLVTEIADYHVSIDARADTAIYSPVPGEVAKTRENRAVATFTAENLRDFAFVAGSNMRAEQRQVGDVTIRTIFRPEHEAAAQRALNIAANAVRVFTNRIGPMPIKFFSIVDAPLVATLSSAEFSGLSAIASAFYLDFDSPAVRNMPDLILEQRASVEESLEWTVAHVVAHEWWGATVGNDPAREPVLDEALANWSALLYYRETYGDEKAAMALDEQLRGVYKLYRTFGGEDMEASRPARDYRNSFQYAAIVTCKGALMFEALRKLVGDEKFFAALRKYYTANQFEVAEISDLRGAFIGEAPLEQRRGVSRTFDRWLSSKNGDEDIAPPDPKLAADLGLPAKANGKGDHNVFTPFSKLGKFFWQQMIRIH